MDRNDIFRKIKNIFFLDPEILKPYGVDRDSANSRTYVLVNNITLILVLVFCAIYYLDLSLFSGESVTKFLMAFSVFEEDIALIHGNHFSLYYFMAIFIALIIAIVGAIIFFYKYGAQLDRSKLAFYFLVNEQISQIWTFFAGLISAGVFLFGGYLVSVVFVESTFLRAVPCIEFFQAIVAAKASGFVGCSVFQSLVMLFPYRSHPKA